jgi:hypothetical protein
MKKHLLNPRNTFDKRSIDIPEQWVLVVLIIFLLGSAMPMCWRVYNGHVTDKPDKPDKPDKRPSISTSMECTE